MATTIPRKPVAESSAHEYVSGPPSQPQQGHSSLRSAFSYHLDRLIPSSRGSSSSRKRKLLIAVIVTAVILLALILGLSIGLTRGGKGAKALPLGTQQYTGDLTYYGTGLGACGITSHDSDMIVSISHFVFDAVRKGSDPNANPLCGKHLRAVRDGKSVDLKVVDRCVGCQPTDIDVAPSAFDKLANHDLGRVPVTWAWLEPVPTPS